MWQYYQQVSDSDDNEGDTKQQIFLGEGQGTDKTNEWKNKLNISQLTLVKPSNKIDSDKALTVLDTNIFELLPTVIKDK